MSVVCIPVACLSEPVCWGVQMHILACVPARLSERARSVLLPPWCLQHQQHHHHHHHQPPLQQHLFGSPQQLTSHMHQRLRSSQRSHSFQGLSPASFIPPPPPPSNFKFSMVGGSSLPGTPSHVQVSAWKLTRILSVKIAAEDVLLRLVSATSQRLCN